MNNIALTNDIDENIKIISANAPSNFNFTIRELLLKNDIKCSIIYISGLSSKEDIEERIIYPLLFKLDNNLDILTPLVSQISKKYISINDTEISSDIKVISNSLKLGKTIILIENENNAIICDTIKSNFSTSSQTKIEESIRGDKSSFVEILDVNIGLIQEKLKNDSLKIEQYTIGKENNTQAALIYMENIINNQTLNKLKIQMSSLDSDYIPDVGYLSQLLGKKPFAFFPKTKTTEKPDKVVSDILQGKAAIIINGCCYAIILPVVFIEFFHGFEDYSNKLVLANFDRIIRIVAVLIVLTLGPVYLVLLQYNAELVPISLIKIIITSRKDIPLPPFLEILLMEIIVEFLREGGLRLPSVIGQTLSIVGGITLGQAAIQAGMVSPTTLIVVTITVLATFVIPNYEMSLTIRLLRFYVLIMALILGFLGVIIGLFSIVVVLMHDESFGIPYFAPFAPMKNNDLKDAVLRYPLSNIEEVPDTFSTSIYNQDNKQDNKNKKKDKSIHSKIKVRKVNIKQNGQK